MNRLMICAWIDIQRRDCSSHTRNPAPASARAMPMRLRCPPENWCG
jgi:hypothetical protein